MKITSYLKYYWLEQEYLEKEVHPSFHEKNYLTPEEFFAIIFWKSKRPAKLIRAGLLKNAVQSLTKQLSATDDDNERLDILLAQPGFNIAMASAVLTVLYPDTFTVYDYRLLEQVNEYTKRKNGQRLKDITTVTNLEEQKRLYWEYVALVREINPSLSLRDSDRALWAKSWYEDLKTFVSSPADENVSVENRG